MFSTFLTFFLALSTSLQIFYGSLFFLLIFFIVYIVLVKKEVIIKVGKLVLNLDKKKNPLEKSRSCFDCIKIFTGIGDKWRAKRRELQNSILKTQMNYAETILEIIVSKYHESFREIQIKLQPNLIKRASDYIIYKNILKASFIDIKDEIRRSMKENGFAKMNEDDFESYKSKIANKLFSMQRDYIIDNYSQDIVPDVQHTNEIEVKWIINKIKDVYENAREVAKNIKDEIENLDKGYDTEMDTYIFSDVKKEK